MDATCNPHGAHQPVTKRLIDSSGGDFYPTPPWATFALLGNEDFSGEVWECACGDGTMPDVISDFGLPVISSDRFDHGFGETGHDFLTSTRRASNIITPPFYDAGNFVAHGLKQGAQKTGPAATARVPGRPAPHTHDLPSAPAEHCVGFQRANYVLPQGGGAQRERHNRIRVVRLEPGAPRIY